MSQRLRNLPAMWETWVQSLGQKDPLEKGWQSAEVFLSREFHEQKSLVSYSPWGCKGLDTSEQRTHTHYISI